MVMFIADKAFGADASVVRKIHPELLQAIAMSELMFERWSETPDVERLHCSTLVQQCLSVVAETGGASAATLYDVLVARGAFDVPGAAFAEILKSLGAHDLLDQTGDGDLVMGMAGENLVRRYEFYSAFTAPKQITVVHRGHAIGSIFLALDMIPEGFILLAGRRWKIRLIDLEKNTIDVDPAEGGKAPPFGGDDGPEIHSRVRQRMFEILTGADVPGYLDDGAVKMLTDARRVAAEARMAESPLVEEKRNLLWFPWAGSAVHRTLYAMALIAGMEVEDRRIALEFKRTTPTELKEACLPFLETPPTAAQIVEKFELAGKGKEKYDRFIPAEYLLQAFERQYLDVNGAVEAVRGVAEKGGTTAEGG
jgi:ATP-dependent Lhr-like helicase